MISNHATIYSINVFVKSTISNFNSKPVMSKIARKKWQNYINVIILQKEIQWNLNKYYSQNELLFNNLMHKNDDNSLI